MSKIQKYNLYFSFKNNNRYVQGPDIFDSIMKVVSNDFDPDLLNELKFSSHEMLLSNANLIITDEFIKKKNHKINSIITFRQKEKKYFAILSENKKKIEKKINYSEENVKLQSKINIDTIYFKNNLSYSLSEIVVSMKKHFLQQTINHNVKWIVTKLEYYKLIEKKDIINKVIVLRLLNNLNNKLIKSEIFLDKKKIGYVFFSQIKKMI